MCTARERQTLALLLLGMTNKQIAQDLRIAEDTVKKHLQHIYRKVGVHRRVLLMIDDRAHRPSSAADTPSVE
jgi:DNA-binding CsgD family transcriptional regulator